MVPKPQKLQTFTEKLAETPLQNENGLQLPKLMRKNNTLVEVSSASDSKGQLYPISSQSQLRSRGDEDDEDEEGYD